MAMPWRARMAASTGRQVADQQLAEKLQLLDHLARGEPARRRRCGRSARRRASQTRVDFTAQRPDHLADDVEQEAELPLDECGAVSWGRR